METKIVNTHITVWYPDGTTRTFENVLEPETCNDAVSFYTDKGKSKSMYFNRMPFIVNQEIAYVRKRDE